jgi:hypothetical protein
MNTAVDDISKLKNRLLTVLQSIDTNIGTAHPEQQSGLSRGQITVLSLLAVCRSNLRGIMFLLREDHSEQASIIGRTLLVDAMRVLYFYSNQESLDVMSIAFEVGSIHQERALIKEFEKHVGADQDAERAHEELNTQERELREQAKEMGFDEKALNREVGILANAEQLFNASPQPEGYFIFRHASHAAHTGRLAMEAQKQYEEDGTVKISFGGTPGNVLRVGIQSARVFLAAYRAAAEMLGWETIDAIASFFDYANGELAALQQDADIGGIDEFISGKPSATPH